MGKCVIDKAYYNALADNFDTLGAHSMTGSKLASVDKVSQSMVSALVSSNVRDECNADFNDVRRHALEYYYMFDDPQLIVDAANFLNNIEYVNYKGIDYYEFLVFAEAIKSKTGVCKEPKQIVFPESLKHTSSIFAAHEVAHMLKERNPKECKEIIYFGEVIPMLMELIIAYSYEYGSKESVFAQRSKMIKHSCKSFNELYRTYKELSIAEDKKVYETALSEAGTYVNSFYYTLALFALYIANKDFVLRLVSNVLNCRCTTSDILRYISTMDIERLYETGLEEFNYSI